ncbi:hypothetical protein [Baekduia sp. Peel2402]|uniref:hypothetical protein n=1 Tax=Baekduia sp. Peel2402 TaxID=3458296 RepID=UPI00403E7515
MSDLEQIAYDNAIRALDKQEKLLEELRARTGVLLAAASLAVSLLGGRAFDDLRPVVVLTVALAAFAFAFGASLFVLMPRSYVFALEGPRIYEELFAFRNDPAELRRRLAYDMQRFWEDNDQRMAPVRRAFRLAASSLVVEVLSLTVLATGIL